MNIDTIIALNQAGRVGSSSIYCAGVAERMVEECQRKKVEPAVKIHINFETLQEKCNDLFKM